MAFKNNLNLNKEDKESLADFFRKKDLYDLTLTKTENKKTYNLEFDNRFYGRVDTKRNSIFVDTDFLSTITGGNDIRLLDIPALAFSDLQNYFNIGRNRIAKNSVYSELVPSKGYISIHVQYQIYINDFFSDFIGEISREENKNLTDIKKFSNIFIEIVSRLIKIQEVPFTRTGFLQSIYCSPYVSGLIVDIGAESFNDDQIKFDTYIKDPNFQFFLESANRFGFLVDKNAPWRLIFNTKGSSLDPNDENFNLLDQNKTGIIDLCGYNIEGGYFARNNIINEDDFYNKRYVKSMIGRRYEETSELELLKFMFLQFYNSYVFANSEFVYGKESIKNTDIVVEKNVRNVINLEIVNEAFTNDYWLKVLLYFRALETKQKWNQLEFDKFYKASLAYNKTYNIRSAIDYINNITSNILSIDIGEKRGINRERLVNKLTVMSDTFNF